MSTLSVRLPLYGLRSQFLHFMYEKTSPLYARISTRPRPQWQLNRNDLLQLPSGSLGQQVGHFLSSNQLQLIPGFENHDVFHVLLEYGLSAPEEVELQWCLLGNGKRSIYAFLAAFTGAALFPEYWDRHRQAFRKGRQLRTFHHWYYEYLLRENLADLQHFLAGGELRGEVSVY